MKLKHLFWIFIILAVSGFVAAKYWQPKGHQHGMSEAKELWFCPMHPTYTSDHSGECPICHMRLVKFEGKPESYAKPAANESGKKEFTIDQVLKMKPGEICAFHKCVHGQCKLLMNQDIVRSGKCPHCGENLGILIKENYPNGYSRLEMTPEKKALLGIKTEKVGVKKFIKTIRGVGMTLNDSGWIASLNVYEEDLASIRPGLEVELELPFGKRTHYQGKIQEFGAFNPKTHTTRVPVKTDQAVTGYRMDQMIDAVMHVEQGEKMAVTKEAVLDTGNRQIVFVESKEGTIEPREIMTGLRSDEFYEIKEGLREGESVIVSGNFLIDSESRLKASLQSAAGNEVSHDHA